MDGGIRETRSIVAARRLRAVVGRAHGDARPDWRGDLRLFAVAWAAGFVFFLILIG